MNFSQSQINQAAYELCRRSAKECNTNLEDDWKIYSGIHIGDARAALAAITLEFPEPLLKYEFVPDSTQMHLFDEGEYYEVADVDALLLAAQLKRDEAIDEVRDATLLMESLRETLQTSRPALRFDHLDTALSHLNTALDALGAE